MFGTARLHRLMLAAAALPLEALLPQVLREVLTWSHERAYDDLSLLALEVER
jgi:hypothetical protein